MAMPQWHGDKNGQEIALPSCEGHLVRTMSMKLPYLILVLRRPRMAGGSINVYRVMTEDNAKEIKADAYLVKSIGLEKAQTSSSLDGFIGILAQTTS